MTNRQMTLIPRAFASSRCSVARRMMARQKRSTGRSNCSETCCRRQCSASLRSALSGHDWQSISAWRVRLHRSLKLLEPRTPLRETRCGQWSRKTSRQRYSSAGRSPVEARIQARTHSDRNCSLVQYVSALHHVVKSVFDSTIPYDVRFRRSDCTGRQRSTTAPPMPSFATSILLQRSITAGDLGGHSVSPNRNLIGASASCALSSIPPLAIITSCPAPSDKFLHSCARST